MFEQSVSHETRLVLEKIAQSGLANNFYLGGGTALALHLGHRESIDLDWFSQADFSNGEIKDKLSQLGKLEIAGEAAGTVNAMIDGVKITFLRYRYQLLFPLVDFEKIKLADERDIAAMKIDAASSRGSKKDFIDLYFLMKKYTLAELIGIFEQKYKEIEYNKLHILKSLVYFEDAESEPMPIMLQAADWEEVKKTIQSKVNEMMDVWV